MDQNDNVKHGFLMLCVGIVGSFSKHPVGSYIYDVHTEGGGGVLKFATCLRILLFLNNRYIVHFCGWWG